MAVLFASLIAAAAPAAAYTPIVDQNTNGGSGFDVRNVSTANGAAVQQWQFTNGVNQEWQLVGSGIPNFFEIQNQNSGKCLDVPNASTSNGTLLQQYGCWNGPQQLWGLAQTNDPTGSPWYQLVNYNSGKAVDVPYSSTQNGVQLQQWGIWNTSGQKWQSGWFADPHGTVWSGVPQMGQNQAICAGTNTEPHAWLNQHGATIMRFVDWGSNATNGLQCIQSAINDGRQIYFTDQLYAANGSECNLANVAGQVAQVEGRVAPYLPYATYISIGNENDHSNVICPSEYRAIWDQVEPWLAANAPNAKLVFGEASPWGYSWLQQAWTAAPGNPAGVYAVSIHDAYRVVSGGGLDQLATVANWAASQGVKLFASEGTPDVLGTYSWSYQETPAQYFQDVQSQENAAPAGEIVGFSDYYWPQMGGL